MKSKWIRFFVLLLIFIFMRKLPVNAGEEEKLLDQLEIQDFEKELQQILPDCNVSVESCLNHLIHGEIEAFGEEIREVVSYQFFRGIKISKTSLILFFLLAIVSSLYRLFAELLDHKQIGEMGFFLVYILAMSIGMQAFSGILQWVTEGMEMTVAFMKLFGPVFCVAITLAKGSFSATALYNILILVLILVEHILLKIILPAIWICVLIKMLNALTEESFLEKWGELLEQGICWGIKMLIGLITGLHFMQSLLAPGIDTVKRSVINRSAEAIPGVGDAIGGMTEVVLGTTVLVKNAIGIIGMLWCMILWIAPLMQVGITAILYLILAAMLQPVAHKQMVDCIDSIGKGCLLLVKVIFAAGFLFLLTIAIAAASTGRV